MVDYILKNIFSIFGKEKIKLIIYYGNKFGNDIDVFVVLLGSIEYNCRFYNQLDITYVGDCQLYEMIECLDPLLTEPILTGEIIFGNGNPIRQKLIGAISSEKAINYLRDKASLFIQWAQTHFQNGALRKSCDCIRFSVSFYCFAEYYKVNKKVIIFSSLLSQLRDEYALIEKAEKMAKEEQKPAVINVECLLEQTRQILTKA